MKTKLLVLLLMVAILTTVLCSCEVLKFANHVLDFVPKPDNNNDTNININIGGTTAHVHTEGVIPAVESTCTKTGLTEGRYCTSCGDTLVPQEESPLKAHMFDDDRDATCNNCNFVRDITCYHTHIEFLEAKDSTCTETGLTEGRKCEDCGLILVAQEVVELKEHTSNGEWIIDKNPTYEEEGSKHMECTVCGNTIAQSSIPMLVPASEGLEFKLNDDGNSYTMIGLGTCSDKFIVIPDTYEGKPVTVIGSNAFEKNSFKIKSITIPNSITKICYAAFSFCTALTEIVIPDSVTVMEYKAFQFCRGLESITLSKSLTSLNTCVFLDCSSLKTITIPDSIEIISGEAFSGCTNLESINISATSNLEYIADRAFLECTSLQSIFVPHRVSTIHSAAFRKCVSLKNIEVSSGNKNYKSIDGNLYEIDGRTLLTYASGKEETSFVIPDSVEIIGLWAFQNCPSLVNITIPDSVETIEAYAFMDCSSLVNIEIPDSVTNIGSGAFMYCSSLTSVTLPNSITNASNYLFDGCISLTNINVGEDSQYYKSIDGNLYSKDGKTLVCYAIGKEDTSFVIPDTVTSITERAFLGCTSLVSIIIPKSVTNIGYYAFQDCTSLESIIIPDSVTTIGNWVFSGCKSLTIYCEAESKPSGWCDSWSAYSCPVVWGYTGN